MRRLVTPLLILALTAVAVEAETSGPDCLMVVVNAEVPVESITPGMLQRIYLGKTTRWEGGLAIRPVMLHDHEVHEAFVTDLLDRSEENFSVYWKRMVFTGKGRPPRAFNSDEELAAYLRETPGAIGFLSVEADATDLKIVTID